MLQDESKKEYLWKNNPLMEDIGWDKSKRNWRNHDKKMKQTNQKKPNNLEN